MRVQFDNLNRSYPAEDSLTAARNRREVKYENLSVTRLPMMKIDAKASYILPSNIVAGVHEPKKLFGLIAAEEC